MSVSSDSLDKLLAAESTLAELGPRPYHLPLGPLAPIVQGAFEGSSRSDWISCGPRARIGAVLRGCSVERLVDARAGARPYRILPSSDAPGQRALHAVGLAMARKERVLCILSDASVANGAFHEALNVAASSGAPVTFLVALHPHTAQAPFAVQLSANPARLAEAFGVSAIEVEGSATGIAGAVAKARESDGASLIVTTVPRS